MAINPHTEIDFETTSTERTVRAGLRTTLIQRVKVVGCHADEKCAVAEVEWKRGSIRQVVRNSHIGLSGKRPSEAMANRIAELRSFRITEASFASNSEAIFNCAVENLREDWCVRFEVEPLMAECFSEQAGIDIRLLQHSWKNIGRATGYFSTKGNSKGKESGRSEYWIKELVDGGFRELSKCGQKSQWTNEQLGRLVDGFHQIKDPRCKQSKCYPAGAMLAIICLARYAGFKSIREHHQFASELDEDQRRALGLKKADRGSGVACPSHHALNDFITACNREVQHSANDRQLKWYDSGYSEEDVTNPKFLPACQEWRVRKEFNSWLSDLEKRNFTGKLWSESKKREKEGGNTRSASRPTWTLSKSNERKFRKKIVVCRTLELTEFTGDELLELSRIGEKFAHTMSDPVCDCPYGAIVAIIGLGRCYTPYDPKELCLWCYRLSDSQLRMIGFVAEDSKTGKPLIPSIGCLGKVMRLLGERNLYQLYLQIGKWIGRWRKEEYLRITGGKVRKGRRARR